LHNHWTPYWGKLLLAFGLFIAASAPLLAQAAPPQNPPTPEDQTEDLVTFRGPGVAGPGAGDIGTRGGQANSISVNVGVNGVYDTNVQSLTIDSSGNAVSPNGLWGTGIGAGVYGVHNGRRDRLGVDYSGQFRKYFSQGGYGGSDHALRLGYTNRLSKTLALELQQSLGTTKFGNGTQANALSNDPSLPFSANTSLFDYRANFVQSGGALSWLPSARSSFTFGGQGYYTQNKLTTTSSGYGYIANVSYQRRMTRRTTVGASYAYSRYQFAKGANESSTQTFHGTFAYGLGGRWSFFAQAGASHSTVDTLQAITLDPALAVFFGTSRILVPNHQTIYFPDGSLDLRRKFGRSTIGVGYFIGLGVDLQFLATTRRQTASVSYAYSATRRLTLSGEGGYYASKVVGPAAGRYGQYSGSAAFAYLLGHGMNMVGSYNIRRQQVDVTSYKRDTYSVSLGLTYATGTLPFRFK